MAQQNDFPALNGKLLIAMPGMGDNRFERTVIYLCAHSAEGAMGFVINKTMDEPGIPDFLVQLEVITQEEAGDLPPLLYSMPIQVGGPVEPGRGFVLHSSDFQSSSTVQIQPDVCLTATLEILRAISRGKGPAKFILALGYSGWAAGQLEAEISKNAWLTADGNDGVLFDVPNEDKYSKSLALLGVDETLLSSDAGHA